MREMLCRYDIQSPSIRKYFRRYLHGRTDHFIHEFYNFAVSAYDIVGYDRQVDYTERNPTTSAATVEISDASSDGEVQVIEPIVTVEETRENSGSNNSVPVVTTTVVLETSGARQENCIITDVTTTPNRNQALIPEITIETITNENESNRNPVLLESSSDSECQFVLALKPPHLRTPEMLSLDSASDSDVVFIPNPPEVVARVDSSSTDSEDNKPLALTKMKLKAEIAEETDIKLPTSDDFKMSFLEPEVQLEDSSINFGATTSQQEPLQSIETPRIKKFYFAPKRKRVSAKNIFEQSSSSDSSNSDNSSSSSESSNNNDKGYHKSSKRKRRRLAEKNMKRKRLSTAQNQKPLNQLPSTEKASDNEEHPRIRSVIIVKNTSNHHYIKQKLTTSSESSSSGS